jgi:DNA-binding HxlR family transcriptional regulator
MQVILDSGAFVMQATTMQLMLGRTYESQVCSIARALEVVGERWTLLILRNALFADSKRFNDFQRSLGIATNVLTARLDSLVEAGIMRRHRYSEQPEREGPRLRPRADRAHRMGRQVGRARRPADPLHARGLRIPTEP